MITRLKPTACICCPQSPSTRWAANQTVAFWTCWPTEWPKLTSASWWNVWARECSNIISFYLQLNVNQFFFTLTTINPCITEIDALSFNGKRFVKFTIVRITVRYIKFPLKLNDCLRWIGKFKGKWPQLRGSSSSAVQCPRLLEPTQWGCYTLVYSWCCSQSRGKACAKSNMQMLIRCGDP